MLDCQLSLGCLADFETPDRWLEDFLRPEDLEDDSLLLAACGSSPPTCSASHRPARSGVSAHRHLSPELDRETASAAASWDDQPSPWMQPPGGKAADSSGISPRLRPAAPLAKVRVHTPPQQKEVPAAPALDSPPQQQGETEDWEEARARRIQTLMLKRQLQLNVERGSPTRAESLPPLPPGGQQQPRLQWQQPAGCGPQGPVLLCKRSLPSSSPTVLPALRLSPVVGSDCPPPPPSLPPSPLRAPLPCTASVEPVPPYAGGRASTQEDVWQEPKVKRARLDPEEDRPLPIPSFFSLLQENVQLREELKLMRGVLSFWLGQAKVAEG